MRSDNGARVGAEWTVHAVNVLVAVQVYDLVTGDYSTGWAAEVAFSACGLVSR
jgi:hypothetical protein